MGQTKWGRRSSLAAPRTANRAGSRPGPGKPAGFNTAKQVRNPTEDNIDVAYRSSIIDPTLSTISHADERGDSSAIIADELVLLLECDRPKAASARHRLIDVDEVVLGRGMRRHAERSNGRLVLKVPDGRVSTVHAFVRREGNAFILQDAGSKNGVSVNGVRVTRHLLRDRDVIECGRSFFLYRVRRARPADDPLDVDCADVPSAEPGLFTFHAPLAQQLQSLNEIAQSAIPTLVLGPSGSGKELVARAIHKLSQRRGSFVSVNCGALPENLVEAELFGARRGAFTGATEDRIGLVRASDNGTLFLDEVGELPQRAQVTLLRTLQEHEVLSIGATKPVPVNLRLVTATHRDLDSLIQQERFRPDLLARISGFVVRLPVLRDRIEDFGILTAALLARHAAPEHPSPTISVEAMRLLLRHSWPLNVRELEHCLRAALVLSPTRIDVEHLSPALRNPTSPLPAPPQGKTPSGRSLTPEQERRREELYALLVEHRGNISEVARILGKDRVQIRRWIKLFAISLDQIER